MRVRARWGGSWIPRLVLGLLLLLVVPSWFPVAGEYLLPRFFFSQRGGEEDRREEVSEDFWGLKGNGKGGDSESRMDVWGKR